MITCNSPMTIFYAVIFIALFNAGIVLISEKIGFSNYYDVKRAKWMPERCEFCACFWAAWLELIVLYFWKYSVEKSHFEFWEFSMTFVFAICSAVVSRFVIGTDHANY